MDFKSLNFEIKADEVTDEGSFTAYASVFGNVDKVNDVVVKGAFSNSLAIGKKVRMLYQHDPSKVIGVWDSIEEDDHGLKVKGRFADTELGKEVRSLVLMGAIDSLSIGYRTKDYAYDANGVRLLKEVDLVEISIVTIPANEAATIIDAKSEAENEITEITRLLSKRVSLLKS